MSQYESKHSALKQKIGDSYHYLVAIKYMLENSEWDNCHIEYSGDISLINQSNEIILSIEVKHHIDDTELNPIGIELWKTIYNFYNDSQKYTDKTLLCLFTVSLVSESSKLYNWNDLSSTNKLDILKEVAQKPDTQIYKTIEKYYNEIFKDENRLESILEKFSIYSEQTNYAKYKNELMKESYFKQFVEDDKKISVIESLIGFVLIGFKNEMSWNISKNDFEKKLQEISISLQGTIIRDDNDVGDIDVSMSEYISSKFVDKLQDIKANETLIDMAIEDYAKTLYELDKRMDLVSSFDYQEKIDTYEKSLVTKYNIEKSFVSFNDENVITQSQQFYKKIITQEKVPFLAKSFDDKTTFFQRGYYQILADNDNDDKKKIIWHLGK